MTALQSIREEVRGHLSDAADRLGTDGMPRPALDGKLLRPLAAFLIVPERRRPELGPEFWAGALAIEMVHEASLLHDDILDEAPERRGRPTMAAEVGVGPALVLGDHLLTAAYRAAAASASPEFLRTFIRSVERTVAGEIHQERSQGRSLQEHEYRTIVTKKSGELFRAAFFLGPTLLDLGVPDRAGNLGARLGCLYQMVDDLLDYCPSADRGKVPLQDYRQRKWTWTLGLAGIEGFQDTEETVVSRLFQTRQPDGRVPAEEGVALLRRESSGLLQDLASEGLEANHLGTLLEGWVQLVHASVRTEIQALGEERWPLVVNAPARPELRRELRERAAGLARPQDRLASFGRHSKSFRFAARLFPQSRLRQVADVYAFCRFTDDLVDEAQDHSNSETRDRLLEWYRMCREAYYNPPTGVPLLDDVMGEMRRRSVPFHYAEDLLAGVAMDLDRHRYRSLEELRVYSYRVASTVGGWLTELFGIKDPWVLERAYALGHAMQLTNILRDVGEDLRSGRLYLPEDRMQAHGIDRGLLDAKLAHGTVPFPGYQALMEEVMAEADREYVRAFEAIPSLPRFFQGPVAVAAGIYRGIHREIRRNDYDNLNRRAYTSLLRKVVLAARSLLDLRRVSSAASNPAPVWNPAGSGPREEGQEATA